jgi:EAL domain-containing protein (putative c-di-GMP-specific phosphodiesterase class I)
LFEVSEREESADKAHLKRIFDDYAGRGFKTAIDDFGAGYAGLGLLVDLQPQLVKIDMSLLRGVDADPVRQAVVKGVLSICRELGIEVLAEGIETVGEYEWFLEHGVRLAQGYLFARPGFECLPEVVWP